MGAIHVDVTIRNPGDRHRSWTAPFLVDTGATDSVVPRAHLEEIGVEPVERMVYELADGTRVPMDVGVAQIEFLGKRIGGTIVFGDWLTGEWGSIDTSACASTFWTPKQPKEGS